MLHPHSMQKALTCFCMADDSAVVRMLPDRAAMCSRPTQPQLRLQQLPHGKKQQWCQAGPTSCERLLRIRLAAQVVHQHDGQVLFYIARYQVACRGILTGETLLQRSVCTGQAASSQEAEGGR